MGKKNEKEAPVDDLRKAKIADAQKTLDGNPPSPTYSGT